jgi:hypothetical protein
MLVGVLDFFYGRYFLVTTNMVFVFSIPGRDVGGIETSYMGSSPRQQRQLYNKRAGNRKGDTDEHVYNYHFQTRTTILTVINGRTILKSTKLLYRISPHLQEV